MLLQCGARSLDCSYPRIMAVLNVTPDSFYDGGTLYTHGALDLDKAIRRVEALLIEGADIVDVGGESTRPGAHRVAVQEELERVAPVVDAIAQRFDTVISVDTSSPQVMTAAAAAGAGMINDVRALEAPGALLAARATGLPVCLMHMQGSPESMQDDPHYGNAVGEVLAYLARRKQVCLDEGIPESSILVDPGIGFGKVDDHNLALIRHLHRFVALGVVVLGVSRKSMFGRLLGRPLEQRLAGSLATALLASQNGARILRVHDVAETRDVLLMQKLLG